MAEWSIWGAVQHSTKIIRGLRQVSTAGHGGILVSKKLNEQIPAYMRNSDASYEEDCAWCIPFCVFEEKILADAEYGKYKEWIVDGTHKENLK